MITVDFSSAFYREVSLASRDGSEFQQDLDGTLDFQPIFDEFSEDVIGGLGGSVGWSVTSLTSTQLVQTHPGGYSRTISGSGISPVSSLAALEAAIDAGLANGTLNTMVWRQGAHEFLRVTLSDTGYVMTSGRQSISLTGALTNSLATAADLAEALDLADVDRLYAMSSGARAAVFATLSDFGISGFSVVDDGVTVLSLAVTQTTATLTVAGYALSVSGDLPGDFGDLARLLFDAHVALIEDGVDRATSVLEALDLTGLTFRNPAGELLLSIVGRITEDAVATFSVDGINADEAAIFFEPVDGAEWFANSFGPGGDGVVDNFLMGTFGNDTLEGGSEDDVLFGFDGNDLLYGGAGDDLLNPGENTSTDRSNFDMVAPGTGDDTIDFADIVDGYAYIDHFDLSEGISVTVNGVTNVGFIDKFVNGSTTFLDVANPIAAGRGLSGGFGLIGTGFDDQFDIVNLPGGYIDITGGDGPDRFQVAPGTGEVRLYHSQATRGIVVNLATGIISNDGLNNQDTITGGGVTSISATNFADSIRGGSSIAETYILRTGADTVNGGGGYDIVRYDRNTVQAVTVDLQAQTATGMWFSQNFSHRLIDIDEVRGSLLGNDSLRGDAAANKLLGKGGNDSLEGRDGNDTLLGEDGLDTLFGGDGLDALLGGLGNDVLYGGQSALDLRDLLYGGDGNDSAFGGAGNDELRGDAGNDTLDGGVGADSVIGGIGDDLVGGASFGDVLFGGDGNDFLNGGFGFDRLNGGSGADRFFHQGVASHGSDWIQDFNSAAGDVLVFGTRYTASELQVNYAFTPNAGSAGVQEAFVIHRPTGHILFALVDGGAQDVNVLVDGVLLFL